MYLNVVTNKTIDYEEFVQRASKLTQAKGIFDSVEENIRDYFKPFQPGNIYLVDGSTHKENMGKVFLGLTLYRDLSSIQEDIIAFQNGTNDFFKTSKRNRLSSKIVLRIVSHFLL